MTNKKKFHQDIKEKKCRYQSKFNMKMMAHYCQMLKISKNTTKNTKRCFYWIVFGEY